MKHKPDKHSLKLQKWIRGKARSRAKQFRELLDGEKAGELSITHALHGAGASALRRKIVAALNLN